MASFLEDMASDLYGRHRQGISQLTFIFPNECSGQVFKQYLASYLPSEIPLPKVLSLGVWLQQLSPLKQAQSLLLTHILYQTFQRLRPREESFEQFYFWGNLLLEDFDVVDKYLIDAVHLFTDLSKHKEFSLSYDYLTEAQRTVIQSFWKNFSQRLSTHQQDFLYLWKLLPQVYQHFNRRLYDQGIGYQGLCHRAAYAALLQGTISVQNHQLVFAGFNALTPVEEKIMAWHQENLSTSFYWDLDAYYMENHHQEAGFFLRKHQEKTHFQASFSIPFPSRIAAGNQEIYVTEVASEVGQVQVISTQLKALIETQGASFVPKKTAIVIANEMLRLPMLHALPLDETPVSTHLGYPLRDTTTYHLLEYLLALQVDVVTQRSTLGHFATHHVLTVLKHPHVMACDPNQIQAIISSLQASKRPYVAQEDLLGEHCLYAKIFKIIGPKEHIIPYLIEVLRCIEAYTPVEMLRPIEKVALQQLLQQLDCLQELLVTAAPPKHEVLLQLLRQLVQPLQLPLDSQVSDGVQVLDVLATQNLDFDYVFIVGMNEGHCPAQAKLTSFIPYSLRKGYGLPTADQHQAALYAYYFYRLLQRARQVYITYSTQITPDGQGEMSRYLLQLLYESKLSLKKSSVTYPIHLNTVTSIVIAKKGVVLQQLKKFLLQSDGAVQHLTPSSLNTYLDCSLRFYFQYLAQLKVQKPKQQATHAMVFGSMLHKVMENLYVPLMSKKKNKLVQSQDIEVLQEKISTIVQETFAHMVQSHHMVELPGDHTIAQAIMVKLVHRICALDQAYTPFLLVGLEMGRQLPLYFDLQLNSTTSVRLQGIIDRVDWKAGVFRVLDYKTNIDERKIKSISSLFDRTVTRRNKMAFQVLFYAWLFYNKGLDHFALPASQANFEKARIMPGLFNVRQIFNTHFDTRLFLQTSNRTYKPIEDITRYQNEWEKGMKEVLTELLNPAIPFVQTDDETRCTLCPYKGICERHPQY